MKSFFLYSFLGFFFLVLVFSFFFKWGRIENISFSAKGGAWRTKKDQAQVIQDLKVKTESLIGQWTWELSIGELKQIVQSHPKVEQVQIFRSWPNRFLVLLLSEEPMFLLIGRKLFYPVTVKGTLLEPVSAPDIPDLPLLRGDVFFDQLELRKKAVQLFLYTPKKGIFSQNNISEIKYSKKDQNFYFYLLQSGLPVRVGENLPEFRPDRINNVLKYLGQKKIKWRVIDARFSQKVIVSLDKDS